MPRVAGVGRIERGGYGEVAAEAGVSVSLVKKVARGERKNARVRALLEERVRQRKAKLKRVWRGRNQQQKPITETNNRNRQRLKTQRHGDKI